MKKIICVAVMAITVLGAFAKPRTVKADEVDYCKELAWAYEKTEKYMRKFTAECGGEPTTIIIYDEEMMKVGDTIYTYDFWGIMEHHSSKIGYKVNLLPIEGGKKKSMIFCRKIHGAKDFTGEKYAQIPKSCSIRGLNSNDGHLGDDGWVFHTYYDYFDTVFQTKDQNVDQIMWYKMMDR